MPNYCNNLPNKTLSRDECPSNTFFTNLNALPRDIRVRGSKPVNSYYRIQSMEHKSSTTHTQPSNTEKHSTQPKNNEDTNIQQTPSTKNHSPSNSYRKGTETHKSFALLHTNDSKINTNNTEETNKVDHTLGNHRIFQLNHIPEEPAKKNITKTINKTQTTHISMRNFNSASFWGFLLPAVPPRKPPS